MTTIDGIDYVNDDALVVHLSGHLDPSDLLQILRSLTLSCPWVVLDLERVPELDPSILAILAGAQRRLRPHGYRIALWQLWPQPRQLVHEGGYFGIIDVVDGDLPPWLADRRRDAPSLSPANASAAPTPTWAPLLSSQIVTGLGTTTGRFVTRRQDAR